MKGKALICALAVMASACSDEKGVGFNSYEVPKKTGGAQVIDVQWRTHQQIPRYRVQLAETAESARAVQPFGQSPKSSVTSVSTTNVWLRVVEDTNQVWLVAETAENSVPDTPALRKEVAQRSGCLIGDTEAVGAALVFKLDCR